jgi:hypothetical protein
LQSVVSVTEEHVFSICRVEELTKQETCKKQIASEELFSYPEN